MPNLLANGSQGIAVGMATSIPPHNIAELCDAALYLIAHPDADTEALATFVPGPDFPTGGLVIDDRSAIIETYRTGRGAFRVRARWTKEDTGRGGWVAVVSEIPYGVQKSRLIEQIANLLNETQNSAARRHPRRIDRGRAHRARAAHPRSRAGNADGILVQADRA